MGRTGTIFINKMIIAIIDIKEIIAVIIMTVTNGVAGSDGIILKYTIK